MPARKKIKQTDNTAKDIEESPVALVGRENEFHLLLQKLESALFAQTPVSIYVCGRPGTGKTFTVAEVVKEMQRRKPLRQMIGKVVVTSGMAYSSEKDLFSDLARRLDIPTAGKSLKILESEVKSVLSPRSPAAPMTILIIDEIDKLVNGARAHIVETVFNLPFLEGSKTLLVTIANAVDLTERVLARIKHREIRPEVILFETYSEQQIVEIVQERLRGVEIEEQALTYCAKKVSQTSGDIRAALDLLESARTDNAISFSSVVQLATQFFTSPTSKVIRGLPFQMQMVLNTLTLSQCNSQVTVREAFTAHAARCRQRRWEVMSSSDFFEALSTLDIYGLVRIVQPKGAGEAREAEVEIQVTREELGKALEGLPHVEAALVDRD